MEHDMLPIAAAPQRTLPLIPTTGPGGRPLGSYLTHIGVQGYGDVEPIILAGIISGDPLLLVGRAGTGKTYLLNSLSEVLGLEHRHYNASLITFDDLVGFPMPDESGSSVRYLQTPATIWGAGSVLVDEINRCKPEHQNRFFSLVHERRIQGMLLHDLRYRWAAMNPAEAGDGEAYAGCEPLDSALADRFAFVVTVKDWHELTAQEQQAVADPRGEGLISNDRGSLLAYAAERTPLLQALVQDPPAHVTAYCCAVATELNEAGVRISPRRVRQLVRNHLALIAAGCAWGEESLWLTLKWSLPQRAGSTPDEGLLRAAHRSAWNACGHDPRELWLNAFHRADLPGKARMLLQAPDPDLGTVAVNTLLTSLDKPRSAAFALAVLPALMQQALPAVGTEGLNDLAEVYGPFIQVEGEHNWKEPNGGDWPIKEGVAPRLQQAMDLPALKDKRRRKPFLHLVSGLILAKQYLSHDALAALEQEFHACRTACTTRRTAAKKRVA
jgi:MoxR-like ATPase